MPTLHFDGTRELLDYDYVVDEHGRTILRDDYDLACDIREYRHREEMRRLQSRQWLMMAMGMALVIIALEVLR